MSRVLTGLWQVADMERDGRELDPVQASRAMEPYVAAGLTAFDMADHYGSAEVIAGALPREGRDVQMLTKWVPKPGAVTRDDVREAIELSLERLQADAIDLLQFHAWNYHDLSYLDCLQHLQALRDEGLIRHLGLTNFDTAHLRVVVESGIEVVSNQVSHSLVDRRAAGAMAEYCEGRGVKILAYGTLLGGFLSDRWLDAPEPSEGDLATWSQAKYKRFIDAAGGWDAFQRVLRAAADVAKPLGASIANVASRFILDSPGVGGVIVGARLGESEHVDDTLRMLALDLDDEARASIAAAIEGLTPVPGDCGDEYRKPPFLTASGDLSHHLETFPAAFAPIEAGPDRTRVSSGTEWERLAGYSRAVRDGRRILVSGTTASHGNRTIGGDDPAAQTHFVLDKIAAAVESLGGRWEDIVRTRVLVRDVSQWEPVARAHGERFADVLPANTLVEAKLVATDALVEIEAEAMVQER
ncbi:MAG: aldo/keto reductase [Planctomycetota bacterium]